MSEKLALFGGNPAIHPPLARYNSLGAEEVEAARRVVESGHLSGFLASADREFYGGPEVRALERAWREKFGVEHAVSVNSATSGLMAALGAMELEPGDEVVVSPWTMSASATAILVWNCVPVFADIRLDTMNMDAEALERCITPRTRAIVFPEIFGSAAGIDEVMAVADRHGLLVIEDASQAPAATVGGRLAGTVADVGVFSLNCHKHINAGEGGVCVTNNERLAERMQLIRNHGESVVGTKRVESLTNLVGYNFRLTEVQAAIAAEQLKKLDGLVDQRIEAARRFCRGVQGLTGLNLPPLHPGREHVYYVLPMRLDEGILARVERARLGAALRAEGVPGPMLGYVLVHLLPMYQRRVAYGSRGFPWSAAFYTGTVSYRDGICPVAEVLHRRTFLGLEWCASRLDDREVDGLIGAFRKVWKHGCEL